MAEPAPLTVHFTEHWPLRMMSSETSTSISCWRTTVTASQRAPAGARLSPAPQRPGGLECHRLTSSTFVRKVRLAESENYREPVAMATVQHYQYSHYDGTAFQPGAEHTWSWGPWDWSQKGIVVTAQPFTLSTAYRALSVTDVRVRTVPAQPAADMYVQATIRNVGPEPIVIYNVSLTEIAP